MMFLKCLNLKCWQDDVWDYSGFKSYVLFIFLLFVRTKPNTIRSKCLLGGGGNRCPTCPSDEAARDPPINNNTHLELALA